MKFQNLTLSLATVAALALTSCLSDESTNAAASNDEQVADTGIIDTNDNPQLPLPCSQEILLGCPSGQMDACLAYPTHPAGHQCMEIDVDTIFDTTGQGTDRPIVDTATVDTADYIPEVVPGSCYNDTNCATNEYCDFSSPGQVLPMPYIMAPPIDTIVPESPADPIFPELGTCMTRPTDTTPDTTMIICPAIYAPVCGTNGVTYSNSCVADGAPIAYEGVCNTELPITCGSDADCVANGLTSCVRQIPVCDFYLGPNGEMISPSCPSLPILGECR